jgi:hypothetical protein
MLRRVSELSFPMGGSHIARAIGENDELSSISVEVTEGSHAYESFAGSLTQVTLGYLVSDS